MTAAPGLAVSLLSLCIAPAPPSNFLMLASYSTLLCFGCLRDGALLTDTWAKPLFFIPALLPFAIEALAAWPFTTPNLSSLELAGTSSISLAKGAIGLRDRANRRAVGRGLGGTRRRGRAITTLLFCLVKRLASWLQ